MIRTQAFLLPIHQHPSSPFTLGCYFAVYVAERACKMIFGSMREQNVHTITQQCIAGQRHRNTYLSSAFGTKSKTILYYWFFPKCILDILYAWSEMWRCKKFSKQIIWDIISINLLTGYKLSGLYIYLYSYEQSQYLVYMSCLQQHVIIACVFQTV